MKVLAVGAHPDDVELGAGGTLARLAHEGHDVEILVIGGGKPSRRDAPPDYEAVLRDQALAAAEILGVAEMRIIGYPDQLLDGHALLDLVREVATVLERHRPQAVFTHSAGDLNLDHQIVARAVATACRPVPGQSVRELYGFEVASSSEWGTGFRPTMYRWISTTFKQKMEALACYRGEMRDHPHPRSEAGVHALAALRGMQVGLEACEAFEVVRIID